MKTDMYVIIPVHNRKSTTQRCLASLAHQTLSDFQVIVVDDGSTDGTSDMIRTEFPETIILHGDGNLWWSGGTNKGCRFALEQGANHLVTLNDDVVVKPDYLQKMLDAHQQHPDALIGSINLSQEDPPRLLYAGIISHNPWTAKYVKRGKLLEPYGEEFSGLIPTYSLPGRGVLIPRTVFEKIGLFDEEHLRHYAADYDFSLRAAKAGFQLLVNMKNPVYSPYEPERSGGKNQSLVQFFRSFFQFRSSNYLPVSWCYNFRHHPYKWYFPIFFIINIGRKLASYAQQISIL